MAAVIYSTCALTALACAWLLLTGYRRTKYRLLLWGGICFSGLTASNALLVIDKLVVPQDDLSVWRHIVTLISLLIFVYALIWDSES